jgi:hypothetical protein
MATVTIAVEGSTDVPVIRRLLIFTGHELGPVYGRGGKNAINRSLAGFNNAARFAPWLVVRDLDHDAPCAAALAEGLLPHPAEFMRFRIAVRETEAWLIADRDALAEFLRIRRTLVPIDPDSLDDPKLTMVNLARQSRRRDIAADMVPAPRTSVQIGPAYGSRVDEFARDHWRPAVAAEHSESLRRCVERLQTSWEDFA